MQLDRIKEIVQPVIARQGIELYDIELKAMRGRQLIRIIVDTETGIQLSECTELSRILSDVFDTDNLIEGRYTLEVSSPGVDRVLKTVRDFRRNIGRDVRVEYHLEGCEQEKQVVVGKIVSVDEKFLKLHTEEDIVDIAMAGISKGKIVLPW